MNTHLIRPRDTTATSERGAVFFLVAATIMIVLLVGAVAVDLSATAASGQKLQNAADAAALGGVQAYRASDGNETLAAEAVRTLLRQNGMSEDLVSSAQITYPDDVGFTEVKVALTDPNPGRLLGGITGGSGGVNRTATAKFKSCEASCSRIVPIPSPFTAVNAQGQGDGYKPIPVGDKLYAINHNKNQIVCVDRTTQKACWCVNKYNGQQCDEYTETWERRATRYAYAGLEPITNIGPNTGFWNPEMPHAVVFDTTIWWSTSDSGGHHLFCWETSTDTPCSAKHTVTTSPRATSSKISNTKDQNRGGGTVMVNNLIYVFTDDHQVHCFDPDTRTTCNTYGGPVDNSLAEANFPVNDPDDDNHGSSIDRIVDETSGKIYSTIHIKTAVAISGPYDCSSNIQDPEGMRVIIRNVNSGKWVSTDTDDSDSTNKAIRPSGDGSDIKDRWDITLNSEGYFFIRSAVHGMVWDADNGDDSEMDMSPWAEREDDDQWEFVDWDASSQTYKIRNREKGTYVRHKDGDFETDSSTSGATRFSIRPWQCEVSPAPTVQPVPSLPYDSGTWLHCFNTSTRLPCSEFTPARIHEDASRFSGRLFFYRSADGTPVGVCSTGFAAAVSDDEVEITCVGLDGVETPNQASPMVANFLAEIQDSLGIYPWAWGDPHWNESENRLFYPTHHGDGNSRVLCWDFDLINGWCESIEGFSGLGRIEDYGFYSEGNCVYGLGHLARFWAFKASDLGQACTGASTEAIIRPCACSGVYEWGMLNFNVDLSPYASFDIIIEDKNGGVVWPRNYSLGDTGHSLFGDGLTIPLQQLPVDQMDPENDFLVVKVHVENRDGVVIDPNGDGVAQTFEIEFQRSPHLTD